MTMPQSPIPDSVTAPLRSFCMALPEVREEAAWVGLRWRIRQQTFAHVLMINGGRPPAYAQAAHTAGPACVLTFRSPLPEADVHAFSWEPFFKPVWFRDIVGMLLNDQTDWDEVHGLVRASYRHMAPKKLAALLNSAG